jgi:hypothetical protein
MKTTHLILILFAVGATTRAADQTLAPLPKMTAAEAAETILPEGTIVRVVGTSPADVRVGDGLTAGGIRIGDGIGWQEGQTLTKDLNAGANRITVGTWSLQTIGAWGAISGGELSQSAGKFRLSMGGSIFMEAESALSLVQITRFEWVPPYFELDTISGGASPTITYSTNLVSGTWTEVPNVITTTNGATLTHQIDPDEIGTVAFFRATIPSGSGSSVNFTAQILQNGDPVALAGTVTAVSNRVTAVEAQTNTWNTAVQPTDAAYTNALALSGSAVQTETDPVFSAWDKTTGIQISESQITNLQAYLTAETDPAWHAGTNAIYQAIGSNTTAIAGVTNQLRDVQSTAAWNVSTDQAYISIGTNKVWLFAASAPADTNFVNKIWGVSTTNAWLWIGTNRVEVRP